MALVKQFCFWSKVRITSCILSILSNIFSNFPSMLIAEKVIYDYMILELTWIISLWCRISSRFRLRPAYDLISLVEANPGGLLFLRGEYWFFWFLWWRMNHIEVAGIPVLSNKDLQTIMSKICSTIDLTKTENIKAAYRQRNSKNTTTSHENSKVFVNLFK